MSTRPSEQVAIDWKTYQLGRDFLLSFTAVTPEMLDRHLSVPARDRPQNMAHVFRQLVHSAQNRHALPNVIGGAIGGVQNLAEVLCGFEPTLVLEKFGEDGWEKLLDEVIEYHFHDCPPRRAPRSHWPAFCRAILGGAAFLARFRDVADFDGWVGLFDHDDRARPGLPALLPRELPGFGFALSCDFLKELGYHNFSKPDTHLK